MENRVIPLAGLKDRQWDEVALELGSTSNWEEKRKTARETWWHCKG
jgi:hypothetical protein